MQNPSPTIPLAVACATLTEDTPLEEATGTPGIGYGMTKAEVLTSLSPDDDILEVGEGHILAAGTWELTNQLSLKTFEFSEGALSSISYAPLDKEELG